MVLHREVFWAVDSEHNLTRFAPRTARGMTHDTGKAPKSEMPHPTPYGDR